MASLLVILLLTKIVIPFKLSIYVGKSCRGQALGQWVGGEAQGCQRLHGGVAASAIVTSTGPVDDTSTVVFFSSDDCNPGDIITTDDEKCVDVNYASFAVWDIK
ncbi:hypothetical protein EJ08DRAFT_697101 [Tothia fuscella]|uniref:Uncharacterized protein n=1 Tax=Tothia fuscella TaxID=1048955 RepID=A0A9P4NSR6_9PEZI|nr:hypothetical protein EJ08DRAFT_697101 [Tothia fuscella]